MTYVLILMTCGVCFGCGIARLAKIDRLPKRLWIVALLTIPNVVVFVGAFSGPLIALCFACTAVATFLAFSWKAWSMKILVPFGMAMNMTVIYFNNWQMPVNISASPAPYGMLMAVNSERANGVPRHCVANEKTVLPALCDTIPVGNDVLMSIGDAFIFGGTILLPFIIRKKKVS